MTSVQRVNCVQLGYTPRKFVSMNANSLGVLIVSFIKSYTVK